VQVRDLRTMLVKVNKSLEEIQQYTNQTAQDKRKAELLELKASVCMCVTTKTRMYVHMYAFDKRKAELLELKAMYVFVCVCVYI
jgi:hypothetical protein